MIPFFVQQRIRRNIYINDTIGSDDRIVANGYTFKHHDIRAKPDVVTYMNGRSRSRLVPVHDSILGHTVVEVIHMDVWTK